MANLIKHYGEILAQDLHWALTHNWYLRFPDPRFKDPAYGGIEEMSLWVDKLRWVPAESVNEQIASLGPNQISMGHLIYSYPEQRGTSKYLSITIYDTDDLVLTRMFKLWMDFIVPPDGTALRPLSIASRRIEVHKVDNRKRPIRSYAYRVFPAQDINYQGQAAPNFHQITVELFVIAESRL